MDAAWLGFFPGTLVTFFLLLSLCVFWTPKDAMAAVPAQNAVNGIVTLRPLEIELQGGVASYTDDKLQFVLETVRQALAACQTLGRLSKSPNLFSSSTDAPFENRRFQIILTDRPEIRLPNGDSEIFEGYNAYSAAVRFSSAESENKIDGETLFTVLRLDELAVLPDGSRDPLAFANVFSSLYTQILGSWSFNLLQPVAQSDAEGGGDELASDLRFTQFIIDSLDFALAHPQTRSLPDAGQSIAGLYQIRLIEALELSAKAGRHLGPFALPVNVDWTLGDPDDRQMRPYQAIFFRALHLVQALPPDRVPVHFFSTMPNALVHRKDRFLSFHIVDTNDRTLRRASRFPTRVDDDKTIVAQTFLSTSRRPLRQQYVSVYWADRLFYDVDGKPRPDALARVAVALASQIYGKTQQTLLKPIRIPWRQTERQALTEQAYDLRKGVAFVDLLRMNPLWETLSPMEQESFFNVRNEYVDKANRSRCGNRLLQSADEMWVFVPH